MRWSLVLDDEPTVAPERLAVGDEEPEEGCPEGQEWDDELGECVDIEATDETPAPGAPPAEAGADNAGRFRALLIVEDTWSGDGRFVQQDALAWRDLPLPLMGLQTTTEMHQEAVVVGHIDTITRTGNELWGSGPWATDVEAAGIRQHVRDLDIRGVSADLDDVEYEIIFPESEDDGLLLLADAGDRGDADVTGEVIAMEDPKLRVTRARIMGATIVPFPAFSECFIEDLDPTGPMVDVPDDASSLTAAAAPVEPPRAWFDPPSLEGPHPFTVLDSGEVVGHIATWDTCHISFPDSCVPPPRSASGYAHYLHGEVRCSDGSRVAVGQLCLRGGHAPVELSPAAAMAHYDDTDSVIADLAVGEDRHGIWVHGALRPNAHAEAVRAAMAAGVSGDWRRIGGHYELINLSSVNSPGFPVRGTRLYESAGLVASVLADLPPVERDTALVASTVERIAASIGRSTDQRLAALRARVHQEA
jgi:hypothetical protein